MVWFLVGLDQARFKLYMSRLNVPKLIHLINLGTASLSDFTCEFFLCCCSQFMLWYNCFHNTAHTFLNILQSSIIKYNFFMFSLKISFLYFADQNVAYVNILFFHFVCTESMKTKSVLQWLQQINMKNVKTRPTFFFPILR